MQTPEIKRLYYSASDLAKIAHVNSSQLREWEESIPALKSIVRGGRRLYRPKDLTVIMKIKELLDRGFTVPEIAEIMNRSKSKERHYGMNREMAEHKEHLFNEIRQTLSEILDLIDAEDDVTIPPCSCSSSSEQDFSTQ